MRLTNAAAVAAMLLLAMFAAVLAPRNAAAQTRAALVQNVDEPGRSPYQESASAVCFATCTITFSAVPAGMRLVVTHINGSMDTIGTGASPRVVFGGIMTLPTVRGIVVRSDAQMIFNHELLMYFDAGARPVVFGDFTLGLLGSTTDRFGGPSNATLTGYLVKLP